MDAEAEIGWLREQDDAGSVTGFRTSGRDASVWIMHAIYEHLTFPEWLSAEAAQRARAQAGDMGRPAIAEGLLDRVDKHDLWATRVGGPAELIDLLLIADPDLETTLLHH